MSRTQFLILNVLAGLFALLVAVKIILVIETSSRQGKMLAAQATITQAQRAEPLLRELVLRLAQEAQREPDLNDLLRQHNLKVNLPKKSPSSGTPQTAAPASATPTSTPSPSR
ncbi:MAG: hypothetical protein SFU85_02180 [Candidatus Methylacidiphilales bacterium]|nr:hypothetical protein [Candidatus Methylacidiphilales bacterium]